MEAQVTKSQLRKNLLYYRRLMAASVFEERNKWLCQKLFAFIEKHDFRIIHTFLPIRKNNEPDVTSVFQELRNKGRIIVGSTTDFEKRILQHYYLEETTQLVKNRMGIPEPRAAKVADIKDVDLILVPLSAADKTGNRIGYGGGFYDQLLTDFKGKTVGLCLSPLLDKIIQTEEWDIKLDRILTPFVVGL